MKRAIGLLALAIAAVGVVRIARRASSLDLENRPAARKAAYPLPTRATLREGMSRAQVLEAFGPPDRSMALRDAHRRMEGWGYGVLLVMLADGKVTRVGPYTTGKEWAKHRSSLPPPQG